MGRIGGVVCGLLLALGLSLSPVDAFAADGFMGGLQDLTGTREVGSQGESYEESYQESYEPEFREVESEHVRELGEDATTVDYVNDTLDHFNQVNWHRDGLNFTMLQSLQFLFGIGSGAVATYFKENLILVAVGVVFMWWGVRKAKNIIMNSFRKGKIST